MSTPQRTPLYDAHVAAGGRMVDFAGWEMPVQYEGLIAEHQAVRSRAGLFDVSHMGEFEIRGGQAEAFVNYVITNDISRIVDGQAQYTMMCQPDGGIVDDLIVYRHDATHYTAIVNASNISKDLSWMRSHLAGYPGVEVEDKSDEWALLALQGPNAASILAPLVSGCDVESVGRFRFAAGELAGHPCTCARTGYTGEDGFELMLKNEAAPAAWATLLEAGAGQGLKPCGLGARDTLRLEMAYPLYGNDIDETTNPLEAGLGWVVKLEKGAFVGMEALAATKETGLSRRRVGFELTERGVPRHGYLLQDEKGNEIGNVTSGTHSPSLDKAIGVGYVPSSLAAPGTSLWVDIRGRRKAAQVVKTPFYKAG